MAKPFIWSRMWFQHQHHRLQMLISNRLALDNQGVQALLVLDTSQEVKIRKEIHLATFSRTSQQCSSNSPMRLQEKLETNLHLSILWSCFRVWEFHRTPPAMQEVSHLPSIQCKCSKTWESIYHQCSHKALQ